MFVHNVDNSLAHAILLGEMHLCDVDGMFVSLSIDVDGSLRLNTSVDNARYCL